MLEISSHWRRLFLLASLLIIGQLIITAVIGLPPGPVMSNDSGFYVDGADRFPVLLPRQIPYVGFIVYLKVCSLFGPVSSVALIGNAIAVWMAADALWQIATRWSEPRAGWIAASIWLLNPLTAQWTRYVLTEPLFFSSVICWLWLAIFKPDWRLLAFSIPATLLRPNAFVLSAAAISWLVATRLRSSKPTLFLISFFWLGLSAAVILLAPSISPVASKLPQFIATGTVIHSHPEISVPMAGPLALPRLMLTRLAWEFAQWRPWYSFRLNAYIVVFMAAFYWLAFRGAWFTRGTRLFWAVVLMTLPSMAVIALTWSIHEGRFAWWVLAAWIPWVAIGCQHSNAVQQRNLLNVLAKS